VNTFLYPQIVRQSRWSQPSSGLKIVPIVTAKETLSPGDALRDIYMHGVITSDFVLVTGDLVSSVKIDEVVRLHKERRKKNKDAIMTIVTMQSGARHRTRCVSLRFLRRDPERLSEHKPFIGRGLTRPCSSWMR
jgi:NDP-sugar pyrophosphorylase family protein